MPETILIVDDTPANLGVLVETLGEAGYQLMVAEDGEEALAQIAQTQPDLILLDIMMPGIDGFETCRRFKSRTETREVPVLFMTAMTETVDKVKAFAAGAVDYLTKPIEHEEALARIRTHLALRRLQREVAEQLNQRETFIRIASHDLRNPLGMVMMASELALRGDPVHITSHLKIINDAALQMRGILDTFLNPDVGPRFLDADPTWVDLNRKIEGALAQQQLEANRKNIRVVLTLEDGLPYIQAHPLHVDQVLTNYLSNALKFTPPGGQVTIRSSSVGKIVRLEVADSGPGVPKNERRQLFQENVKLSPRPTAGEESHGIGLSIVKNLIESEGGHVGASFPEAGGSTFWFELPIAE